MKLEFGTGSIRCHFGGIKGRGALLFKQDEPTNVGFINTETATKPKYVDVDEFPIAMFFSNTESVDAVIDSLKIVRGTVNGEFDVSNDCITDVIERIESRGDGWKE